MGGERKRDDALRTPREEVSAGYGSEVDQRWNRPKREERKGSVMVVQITSQLSSRLSISSRHDTTT